MNKDLCNIKSCSNYGRYARYCGHLTGKPIEKKPINPISKKLAEVMKKEYVPQVKEMIDANTPCELKTEVCTGKAQGFHHPYGKDSEELRMKEKVPACNACNLWVEVNDAAARSKGLKKSKFSIPAKNQKRVVTNPSNNIH